MSYSIYHQDRFVQRFDSRAEAEDAISRRILLDGFVIRQDAS